MAHERNIAALLRTDARTVHVSFIKDVEPELPEDNQFDRLLVAEQRRRAEPEYHTISDGAKYRNPAFAVSPARKTYTYVADLPLEVDDVVVVTVRGQLTLAVVRSVDDEVKIEPGSAVGYLWVVAKVDMANYHANLDRNREIEQTVAEGMRANLRRSFANSFMAGLAPDASAKLGSLIGETVAIGAPAEHAPKADGDIAG